MQINKENKERCMNESEKQSINVWRRKKEEKRKERNVYG